VTQVHSVSAKLAAVAAAVALAGCRSGGGVSYYEQAKQQEQNLVERMQGQGAKVKELSYPQGRAWSVNLSGLTITDDLLRDVRQLGNVSELDLSKSTITDGQLGLLNELRLTTLLLKFDLSNTAVTDAGFEKLDLFKVLKEMNLTGTKVTPAAVERFKRKRQSDERVIPMFKNATIRL